MLFVHRKRFSLLLFPIAVCFAALTVLTLLLAFLRSGLSRRAGWIIIAGYAVFVGVLIGVAN